MCECREFLKNPFKPRYCRNCQHDHGAQPAPAGGNSSPRAFPPIASGGSPVPTHAHGTHPPLPRPPGQPPAPSVHNTTHHPPHPALVAAAASAASNRGLPACPLISLSLFLHSAWQWAVTRRLALPAHGPWWWWWCVPLLLLLLLTCCGEPHGTARHAGNVHLTSCSPPPPPSLFRACSSCSRSQQQQQQRRRQ